MNFKFSMMLLLVSVCLSVGFSPLGFLGASRYDIWHPKDRHEPQGVQNNLKCARLAYLVCGLLWACIRLKLNIVVLCPANLRLKRALCKLSSQEPCSSTVISNSAISTPELSYHAEPRVGSRWAELGRAGQGRMEQGVTFSCGIWWMALLVYAEVWHSECEPWALAWALSLMAGSHKWSMVEYFEWWAS